MTSSQLSTLSKEVDRLKAQAAEVSDHLPTWCAIGTQGAGLIVATLAMLSLKVSEVSDPSWYYGDGPTPEADEECERVGCEMIASGGYAAAQMIGNREIDRWPECQYRRRPQVKEPAITETPL